MWVCLHANIYRNISTSPFKNVFINIRHHWRYTQAKNEVSSSIKYILVLDFEATCDENNKITQEIIEFPCLMLNSKTFNVDGRFHEYVRPIAVPDLSIFCIELTGILQEMVDGSDPFPDVLRRFEKWRADCDLTEKNSVFLTSGDWDLGRMFPAQCQLSRVKVPDHFRAWIDLKKLYARQTNELPKSLMSMVQRCGLTFQGRQHSGIDDCLNMANILRSLGKMKDLDLKPSSLLRRSSNQMGYKVMNLDA